MSRQTFYLSVLLLVLITFLNFRYQYRAKDLLSYKQKEFAILKKEVRQIVELKKLYSNETGRVPYCKKADNKIICNSLDKNRLKIVENSIFRGNIKINSFEIKKRGDTVDMIVEIKR